MTLKVTLNTCMKKASEIQCHYEEGGAPAWGICQQSTVLAVATFSMALSFAITTPHRVFQETALHLHCLHTKPDLTEGMFDSQ